MPAYWEMMSRAADLVIVYLAGYFFILEVFRALAHAAKGIDKWNQRRKRNAIHDRWVAARRAAREEVEARLRAENRWSNPEIEEAMTLAGRRVHPDYHPQTAYKMRF